MAADLGFEVDGGVVSLPPENAANPHPPRETAKPAAAAALPPATRQFPKPKRAKVPKPARRREPREPLFSSIELPARQLGLLAALGLTAAAIWFGPGLLASFQADPADALIPKLKSSDASVRLEAVLKFAEVPANREAADELVRVLKEEKDRQIRTAAASALFNSGHNMARLAPELKKLLANETDAKVRTKLQWIVDVTSAN
jgi:hypothetical protein